MKKAEKFNLKKWLDSSEFQDFKSEFQQQEAAYEMALQAPLQESLEYTRFYMADRDDPRGEDEDWRANTHTPAAYYTIETKVAQLLATLTSSDPLIQAIGQNPRSRREEEAIEKLLENTLWLNRWRTLLAQALRLSCTNSAAFFKVTWRKQAYKIDMNKRISSGEWHDWVEQLMRAEGVVKLPQGSRAPGVTDDSRVDDVELFEMWRKDVNNVYPNLGLPPYPLADSEIVTFEGPHISIPSLYDMRFDPYVSNVRDQEWIAERIIRPRSWLEERMGKNPDDPTKPFDQDAVERALSYGGDPTERFNEYQRQYYDMLGLPDYADDPRYKDYVELFELWQPNSDKPFKMVLNRETVINRDPTEHPYFDRMHPYLMIRNVHLHGMALGMNELKQVHTILHEIDTFRNLRMDALTLKVHPVFARAQGVGVPDLQKRLRPGHIIETLDPVKGIRPLMGDIHIPSEVYRETDDLFSLVDQTFGTTPNVRGQDARVGRVTAVESDSRFKQASQRLQTIAVEIEEDLAMLPHMLLSRWYQFGEPEVVVAMSGGEREAIRIPRTRLFEALNQDYQFRGATQALGRSERVNESIAFVKQFGEAMAPSEVREVAKRTLEDMGAREPNTIINDDNTKVFDAAWKAKMAPAPPPQPPEGEGGGEPVPQVDMALNEAKEMLGGA